MRIFVSYASEDTRTAEEVQHALQQEGHSVFIGSGTEPAQGYHQPLREEVEASDLFIFLISTSSVSPGRYTLTELEYAKDKWPQPAWQVLPVVLEPAALHGAPPYLTALTALEPAGSVAAETAAFVLKLSPLPPVGDVLFDEAHRQSTWRHMPPPTAAGGYGHGRQLLTDELGLSVGVLEEGAKLSDDVLTGFAVLVLPIAPEGGTHLSEEELAAVTGFVKDGKGLLVMGTYTGDWHHEGNLNEVIDPFGIRFENNSIVASGTSARGHLYRSEPTSIHAFTAGPPDIADRSELEKRLLSGVTKACVLSACSLTTLGDAATGVLAANGVDVYEPKPEGLGVAIDDYILTDCSYPKVAAASKLAKVFVTGSWKMFLDAFLDDQVHSNMQLFKNVMSWLAGREAPNPNR